MSDRGIPPRQARQSSLLVLAGLLLISGVVGFVSYGLFLRPATVPSIPAAPAARPVPQATVDGAPAELPAPSPPKVPDRLPELRLPGTDGREHQLADWKGKPLVVNFWATWCDPCRREIPLLKALRREHARDGLEIVGIAIDYPDPVRKYASDHRMDYPVLLGDQDGLTAVAAFGMEPVLPFSVFADREGRVVTVRIGELHRDEAELILDRIRAVDARTLTLGAAQAQISEGVQHLREARGRRD